MTKNKIYTRYFRISVTDFCNLNCYFCHKEGQSELGQMPYLSAEDIVWASGVAVEMGFLKFKITGGEPTLRKDLTDIISGIKKKGAKDISLITNGIRLSEMSSDLFSAGLDRINVSIYSFDADKFKYYCDGQDRDIENIVQGIDSAIEAGFSDIKLNFILHNFDRLNDFKRVLEFAKERSLRVLILPLLNYHMTQVDKIFSFDELYDFIKSLGIKKEEIITDDEGFRQRSIITQSGNKILLRLDYLSEHRIFNACLSCQKKDECLEGILPLRLSATGKILPCLAKGISEIDIRPTVLSRDKTKFINTINSIAEL